MRLDRRQMLCVIAATLVAGCGSPPVDWRARARPWLQAFIPDDDNGAGADCPECWQVLESRLRADPQLEAWLIGGLSDPAQLNIPKSEADLLGRLKSDPFVEKFHRIVVECYYGSAVGWRDLGLHQPPQPKGFGLK